MNMPQHYPQREKSARTLTSDHIEQTCAVQGKKLRCSSLSPVGEKQVITPCKAIAAARGRKSRRKYPNSVGVQHLSFMLRLSQKAKNLTARDAKGVRKERNVFILMHLFFAAFAKNLSVFAVKILLLMITLLVSVTGFSQNGKEIFQNKQSILECTYRTNKDAYKHAKEMYLQALSLQKNTTPQSISDKTIKQCLDSIIFPDYRKEFFSYDTKGNIIINEEHQWNYSTNTWTKRKIEYEYDDHGNLTLIASYQTWLDFDWTGETKHEYSYDSDRNLTMDIYYVWDYDGCLTKKQSELSILMEILQCI